MGELRIIAGEFRRRWIAAPPTDRTRPITDRVREALFSMLGDRLAGANVLDVFCGGGTMGLEALSRGAARCVFLDRAPVAIKTLRSNIETLDAGERSEVVAADLLKGLPAAKLSEWTPYEVVFFDPPYAMWDDTRTAERLVAAIERTASDRILSDGAVLIVRTNAKSTVPPPAGFTLSQKRAYGTMLLWWLEKSSEFGVGSSE